MEEMRILSPCGILGYGFPKESFLNGMAKRPHLIAVDAGSTDAGPHKLGSGVSIVSVEAMKKDLRLILGAAYESHIPVIIGSAGGSGATVHVNWTMDIIRTVVEELQIGFQTAIVWADIDREYIRTKMALGKVTPMEFVPELTDADLDITNSIVGQMGHQPIIEALKGGAQLIVAGRAYDPAVFAAYPIWKGYDPGLAYHMGKILECGALCADPGTTKDCIMGYLHEHDFCVETLCDKRSCHPTSVAAHTLYEKDHPYHLKGPGMELDLSDCTFEAVTDKIVKVTGSRYIPAEHYTIKMEGAAQVAFRTLIIGGVRDPIIIANIEDIIERIRQQMAEYYSDVSLDDYQVISHIYGKNGVMGPLEPATDVPHEIGVVLEVVAKTQDLANTICSSVRSSLMHFPFEGRKATAGNLALLYSPSDIQFGPVFRFTVYHLIQPDDSCELFPVEYLQVGKGKE